MSLSGAVWPQFATQSFRQPGSRVASRRQLRGHRQLEGGTLPSPRFPLNRRGVVAIWAPYSGSGAKPQPPNVFPDLVAHMIAGCCIFRRSDYGQNKQIPDVFFRTW